MTDAIEALREAERFMAYFAGETDGHFVGPGTPQSCLAQIRAALAHLPGVPQAVPACWRYRNEYDEVVSNWIDGPPPEYVRDANTDERIAVSSMKIDVAYSLTRPHGGGK